MRCVGTFDEYQEHTPRPSIVAAARAVQAANHDLIVTFGGTAIDTVKVLLIVRPWPGRLAARRLPHPRQPRWVATRLRSKVPPLRQVVISTTLSAEFSSLAGCSDPGRGVKDAYSGREIGAASVILDPAVTVHTPEWLWLSTGIRAIDHAVEGLCSIEASPLVEATALHALRLLSRSLDKTKQAPGDLAARLESQQGAWLSGFAIFKVPFGASHGIGHSLGAVTGMSHGYTSCVMLPHVMRFNQSHRAEKLAQIASALGRGDADGAGAVSALIERLGMPTRLRDAGVQQAQFDKIASGAMGNIWVRTNPRPIKEQADVINLLDAAW